MANTTIGKKWESKFESTWIKQFPDKLIYRLPDQQAGYAGEGGSGTLQSSALEMSNVDLSTEMADMITTERGFQAASRMITVSDEILQELINLKR